MTEYQQGQPSKLASGLTTVMIFMPAAAQGAAAHNPVSLLSPADNSNDDVTSSSDLVQPLDVQACVLRG